MPDLFEEVELQRLWEEGVEADRDWRRATDSVSAADRGFPPDMLQK